MEKNEDRNHVNETDRYGENFDKFSNSKSVCYNYPTNDWVSQVSLCSKRNENKEVTEVENKNDKLDNLMIDNLKNYDLDEVVKKVEVNIENNRKEEISEVIMNKQKRISDSIKLRVDDDEIVEEEKKMESDFIDTELPWI